MGKGPLPERERESGEGGRRKGCKARDINRLCSGRRGKGKGEGAATAAGDRARHTYTGKGMYDLAMVPHLPYMDSLFPGKKEPKCRFFYPFAVRKSGKWRFWQLASGGRSTQACM